MRILNLVQRLVLLMAFVIGLGFFIFPPTGWPETYGRNTWTGYRYLFDSAMNGHVTDWPRLMLQYALLTVLTWFIVGFLGRTPRAHERTAEQVGGQEKKQPDSKQAGAASMLTAEIKYAVAWVRYQTLKGAVAFEEFWNHIKVAFSVGDAEKDHYEAVFEHAQQVVEDEDEIREDNSCTDPVNNPFARIAAKAGAAHATLDGSRSVRGGLMAIGAVLWILIIVSFAWPDGVDSLWRFFENWARDVRERASK